MRLSFPGRTGLDGRPAVLRLRQGLGVVQARAHAGEIRPSRAEAAGRRRVRIAGRPEPRGGERRDHHQHAEPRDEQHGSHERHGNRERHRSYEHGEQRGHQLDRHVPRRARPASNSPREPQREGGRKETALVRLRRERGRPSAAEKALSATDLSLCEEDLSRKLARFVFQFTCGRD